MQRASRHFVKIIRVYKRVLAKVKIDCSMYEQNLLNMQSYLCLFPEERCLKQTKPTNSPQIK